jgi:4-hydroxy-L-threonine phosphate dehydrogenase PdxA
MGDPSGIGPAITAKAILRLKGLADFVVIGDKWVFNQRSDGRGQMAEVRCQMSDVMGWRSGGRAEGKNDFALPLILLCQFFQNAF